MDLSRLLPRLIAAPIDDDRNHGLIVADSLSGAPKIVPGLTISGLTFPMMVIVDGSGNQITSFGAATVDGSTFTQNTTPGGLSMGVYVSSPQTLTTGKSAAMALDVSRNVMVTLATLIAGENQTSNRLNVEPVYSFQNISTATTTTVKSGAGTLHSIIITNAGATSNTIKIYDNTAASGTVILDFSTSGGPPVVGSYILDASFSTGLTVVTAGTTSPNLTVFYR